MATQNAINSSDPIEVAKGGIGIATLTDHGVIIGSGTAAVTPLAVGANGMVLLGSDAADPVFGLMTSTGSTVAFTPGAGTLNLETGSAVAVSVTTDSGSAVPSSGVLTIVGTGDIATSGAGSTVTIAYSGTGLAWNESTGTTQAIAVGNGYIANNAAPVVLTLPDTAALGSVTRVVGKGAGGWKIEQNAGETIIWNESSSTTTGVTGYLESTDDYDAVELLCTVADTDWTVISVKGNVTVA